MEKCRSEGAEMVYLDYVGLSWSVGAEEKKAKPLISHSIRSERSAISLRAKSRRASKVGFEF